MHSVLSLLLPHRYAQRATAINSQLTGRMGLAEVAATREAAILTRLIRLAHPGQRRSQTHLNLLQLDANHTLEINGKGDFVERFRSESRRTVPAHPALRTLSAGTTMRAVKGGITRMKRRLEAHDRIAALQQRGLTAVAEFKQSAQFAALIDLARHRGGTITLKQLDPDHTLQLNNYGEFWVKFRSESSLTPLAQSPFLERTTHQELTSSARHALKASKQPLTSAGSLA